MSNPMKISDLTTAIHNSSPGQTITVNHSGLFSTPAMNAPTMSATAMVMDLAEDVVKKVAEEPKKDVPRFFLHEEVKLWLKNNLKMEGYGHSPNIYRGVGGTLNASGDTIQMGIKLTIDGEEIEARQFNFSIRPILDILEAQSQEINKLNSQIANMEWQVTDLKNKSNRPQ